MNTPQENAYSATPNAPLKKRVDQVYNLQSIRKLTFADEVPDMELNSRDKVVNGEDNWPTHEGYLNYTLLDVVMKTDISTLSRWLELFSPSNQPRSEEELLYVTIMYRAIQEKLASLTVPRLL